MITTQVDTVIHLTKVGILMRRMSCMESKCQRMIAWMMLLYSRSHVAEEGRKRQISVLKVLYLN
jgi:hypothetical protein